MYINPTTRYYDNAGQHTARGNFLILVQCDDLKTKEIRAIVRKVALHQCGHWMMGSARAFGHRIAISGAYGHDGLPCTVPDDVFEKAIPIPADLYNAWNKGGGWNSCGSEAPLMRQWANKNIRALSSRGSVL